MRDHFEQTQRWFAEALFGDGPIELRPAEAWTDDLWFLDQDNRAVHSSQGWWPLRPGQAAGCIIGGNLGTLNLLPGTGYMPSLAGALLMVEDDETSDADAFARNLTSLLQLPDASGVQGLVIGRFQEASGVTRSLLEQIIARQDRLAGRPVLGNVDFGHTNPLATFPIGGRAALTVGAASSLRLSDS
jgi:muramoyltetrapeptide carboxypeptidase